MAHQGPGHISADQETEQPLLVYPASTVLRLRVIQIVSGICLAIFSTVAGLSGAGWPLLIGGVVGLVTVTAAGLSVHQNPVMSYGRRNVATPSSAGSTIMALSVINNQSVGADRKLDENSTMKTCLGFVELFLWFVVCSSCAVVKVCCLYVVAVESTKLNINSTIIALSVIQLSLATVVLVTSAMTFYYDFRFA